MVISQSFDFPTLYATRGKMNRLKANALDAQATAFRQQILLQAKEVCLDIIMLQRQQALLDERLKNAERQKRSGWRKNRNIMAVMIIMVCGMNGTEYREDLMSCALAAK